MEESLEENLGRLRGFGPLERRGILFGLSLWKDIRKGWRISFLELVSILEMVDTRVFDWITGLWILS